MHSSRVNVLRVSNPDKRAPGTVAWGYFCDLLVTRGRRMAQKAGNLCMLHVNVRHKCLRIKQAFPLYNLE